MQAKPVQKRIHKLLQRVWYDQGYSEWSVRKNATDDFQNRNAYAPRLDIVVGPFNRDRNVASNIAEIERASTHPLTQEITEICKSQNGYFSSNVNPRLLLAIEIEFTGSSKHILGGFTNASMMGFVGLVIGSADNIGKIKKISEYMQTIRAVGKAPGSLFTNVAYLEANKFIKILEQYQ